MGVMELFFEDLKTNIISTLRDLIAQEVSIQMTNEWMSRKETAKYLGVSESWITRHEVPCSKTNPPRYKKSVVDAFMRGDYTKHNVTTIVASRKDDKFVLGHKRI